MSRPAVRPIVCLPDPRLRRPARTVRLPDHGVDRLVEELFATMRSASGLGLAAPQIGRGARVAVIEVEGSRFVLINPEIVDARGVQRGWEGCLSVPGLRGFVESPAHIRYHGFDHEAHPIARTAKGFHARVVQHECDHLDGILYPQRMTDLTKLIFESEAHHWAQRQDPE